MTSSAPKVSARRSRRRAPTSGMISGPRPIARPCKAGRIGAPRSHAYHRPRLLRLRSSSGFVWRLLLHPIQAMSDAAPVRHRHHHRHQLPVTVGGDLFAHKKPDRDMRETAGLLPAHWVWRRLRPAPLSISVYSRPGSRERLLQAARLSLPTHSACTALPVTQNW